MRGACQNKRAISSTKSFSHVHKNVRCLVTKHGKKIETIDFLIALNICINISRQRVDNLHRVHLGKTIGPDESQEIRTINEEMKGPAAIGACREHGKK